MARDLQITSDGKRPSQKPKPGIKVWGYDRGRLSLTPPSEPYGRFSRVIASHRVRAKRGPMTGSAKQSRVVCAALDCFASLAMTRETRVRVLAACFARVLHHPSPSSKSRGR